MQGPTSAPTGDGKHCYTTVACNSSHGMNQHELKTAEYQRLDPKPGNMLTGIACEIAELRATLVWRVRVGPEGAGGRRDTVPGCGAGGRRRGLTAVLMGGETPATGHTDCTALKQNSPNKNRTGPFRYKTHPTRVAQPHCGIKFAQQTPSHRMCGIKLAQQTPSHRVYGIKLALHARNGPFWHVFRMHGELCTVFATNEPRRANFIPHARRRRA